LTHTSGNTVDQVAGGGVSALRVVPLAAVALAMTGPGQTATISAFVQPLSGDLGLSTSVVSTAYLVGTLAGAATMPWWGRLIDRYGPRWLIAGIAVVFGAALLAASTVGNLPGLIAAFVGLRMFGQGALTLAATTAVAVYVTRRRGFALGLTSAVGTAGISLMPLLVQHVVAEQGWRAAWRWEGLAVWAIVIPVALLLPRHRKPRHHDDDTSAPVAAEVGLTLRQAVRTRLFWTVAASVCSLAVLGTALNFHQIALLGERGFTPVQAAANFLPQTVAGLLITPLAGALVDRLAPRIMIGASMAVLAAALVGAATVTPGLAGVAYGFAIGTAGSSVHALEAASFPRYFGVAHIGAIRGFVHALTVAGSAVGPLLLSVLRDATGSWATAALIVVVIPVATAVAGAFTRPPAAVAQHAADESDTAADHAG
jgi:MFS family permease